MPGVESERRRCDEALERMRAIESLIYDQSDPSVDDVLAAVGHARALLDLAPNSPDESEIAERVREAERMRQQRGDRIESSLTGLFIEYRARRLLKEKRQVADKIDEALRDLERLDTLDPQLLADRREEYLNDIAAPLSAAEADAARAERNLDTLFLMPGESAPQDAQVVHLAIERARKVAPDDGGLEELRSRLIVKITRTLDREGGLGRLRHSSPAPLDPATLQFNRDLIEVLRACLGPTGDAVCRRWYERLVQGSIEAFHDLLVRSETLPGTKTNARAAQQWVSHVHDAVRDVIDQATLAKITALLDHIAPYLIDWLRRQRDKQMHDRRVIEARFEEMVDMLEHLQQIQLPNTDLEQLGRELHRWLRDVIELRPVREVRRLLDRPAMERLRKLGIPHDGETTVADAVIDEAEDILQEREDEENAEAQRQQQRERERLRNLRVMGVSLGTGATACLLFVLLLLQPSSRPDDLAPITEPEPTAETMATSTTLPASQPAQTAQSTTPTAFATSAPGNYVYGPASPIVALAGYDCIYEAGHNVCDERGKAQFKTQYVSRFRARLGPPVTERIRNDENRDVQYFRYGVLEHHPENDPPYDYQLSLAGRDLAVEFARTDTDVADAMRRRVPDPTGGQVFFAQYEHHVSDRFGFLTYFEQHGGIDAFGHPVSEAYQAGGTVVQYFERGRFEVRPDVPGIMLGDVGIEYLESVRGELICHQVHHPERCGLAALEVVPDSPSPAVASPSPAALPLAPNASPGVRP